MKKIIRIILGGIPLITLTLWGCPESNTNQSRKPAFTGAGRSATMTLDTSGNPHLVYADDSNLSYKYAYRDATWHTETVDVLYTGEKRYDTLYFIPNSASIDVDSSSRIHVVYYNPYKRTIEYRVKEGNNWSGNTIDSVENYGGYAGNSLVDGKGNFLISFLNIDSNGTPWILYQYAQDADFYNHGPGGVPLIECLSGGSILATLKKEGNIWERYPVSLGDARALSFALLDDIPTIFYIQDGIVKYGEWVNDSLVDKGVLYSGNSNASCAYIMKKEDPFMIVNTPDGYVFGKKINGAWQFESKNIPDKVIGDYRLSAVTDIDKYNNVYYFGAEFYPVDVIREVGSVWYSNTYLGIIKGDRNTWDYIWLDGQPYGNQPSVIVDHTGKIHVAFNYVEEINHHSKSEPYEFHAKLYYALYNGGNWQIEIVDE